VVYNFSRYSEDLDFNSALSSSKTQEIIFDVVKSLTDFGVKVEFRRVKVFKENGERGVRGDVSFEGPLFTGRPASKGKVRIDVSLRGFVLTVLTLEEILAEKVRALIIRGKARDLYDLWVLLGSGVSMDFPRINKKLALYQKTFELKEFKKKIREARESWEIDLQSLLPQVIPSQEVEREILRHYSKVYKIVYKKAAQ